jgi:hypothetical protein
LGAANCLKQKSSLATYYLMTVPDRLCDPVVGVFVAWIASNISQAVAKAAV